MLIQHIFIISTIILGFLLAVSIYFNIKHGLIIVRFTESLEETLDIMDERYSKITEIIETPLFYDSPQVRQVLADITLARDAILLSANILTNNNIEKLEEETEVAEKKKN